VVDHIGGVGGAGGSIPARKLKNVYQTNQPAQGTDSVELSSGVRNVSSVEAARMEKLEAIRKAVADGTYLTDEKLGAALDKAIDSVAKETR